MNLTCNSTAEYEPIIEDPIFHGKTFHQLGVYLCAIFGLFAVVLSFYLMFMHALHYHKPYEQRHIIRILFMVPIYSVVSFLSYQYYLHSVYFDVLRDCYEAFAIASFFALLCHYVAPDLHSQKDYFRTLHPKGWVWPMSWVRRCCGGDRGCARTPRSGLTWFNIIWFCVFQYCVVRVSMTIVAVVSEYFGRYCLDSLSPVFTHIWVTVFEAVSVSVAMYCLVQFYFQLRFDLADHKPGLKVASIKLVIFLSFWQTWLIDILASSNIIKGSATLALPDVKIGVPAVLLCIEMAMFSVLHLWAFPWRPYDIKRSAVIASESGPSYQPDPKTSYQGGFMGIYAFLDAFNPWDLIKAVGRGFKWMFVGRKHREQDISYKPHQGSRTTLNPLVPGKPGRYEQLDDEESGIPDQTQLDRYPRSKQEDADASSYDERQGGFDERTMMPGRREDDTGYHGAHNPSLDPRQHWAADR